VGGVTPQSVLGGCEHETYASFAFAYLPLCPCFLRIMEKVLLEARLSSGATLTRQGFSGSILSSYCSTLLSNPTPTAKLVAPMFSTSQLRPVVALLCEVRTITLHLKSTRQRHDENTEADAFYT
jgi:hypothetical protein